MKKVVGFLSRSHGLSVLNSLVKSRDYQLLQLYTHKFNPKSQDISRSQRSDFSFFEDICSKNKIPLFTVDDKLSSIGQCPSCDFIVEVSWRYLIPSEIIKQANIGAFGIHRGKLPDYAGAEPIKQALLNNEKTIVLSAHYLDNIIDRGDTIISLEHPVNYDVNYDLEANVQRLREEITPLFSKLMFNTFDILEQI